MTSPSPNLLCQPLDVKESQPIVWQKELMPACHISIRPVSVHTGSDINIINEWLSESYPGCLPADQLRVFFILLAESTYAQAFIVLLNDETPIGQLEVYQVWQDELKDAIDANEGDYRIYVPVMPVIESEPEITVLILQSCLTYFFSFPEVKRVFWVVAVNDKDRNKVTARAGFRLHPSHAGITIDGDQSAKIYQCSSVDFFSNL
jgi:hypothetical protein